MPKERDMENILDFSLAISCPDFVDVGRYSTFHDVMVM